MSKYFVSRYIVDVSIEDAYISLKDSSGQNFYIDRKNTDVVDQFKNWFKTIFSQGISGTLTVLNFQKLEKDNEIYYEILKFVNLKSDKKQELI